MGRSSGYHDDVIIPAGSVNLRGRLRVPQFARAVVVFAHAGGAERYSARSRNLADRFHAAGFGSLLFDLLTDEEDRSYGVRFDTDRITVRLLAVTRWLREHDGSRGLKQAYFATDTGVAAAIRVVAELATEQADYLIGAVVGCNGRPDLSGDYLASVRVPTLLITGERDAELLRLNEAAVRRLAGPGALETVPETEGAPATAEDSGRVPEVAVHWLEHYL